MEDVAVRPRAVRYPIHRKKRRSYTRTSDVRGNHWVRQVAASFLLFAVVLAVHNIKLAPAQFMDERIRWVLIQNIDLKSVYTQIDQTTKWLIEKFKDPKTVGSKDSQQPSGEEAAVAVEAEGDESGLALDEPQEDAASLDQAGSKLESDSSSGNPAAALKTKYSFSIPAEGKLASAYGIRLDPIEKIEKKHNGVDIAANTGAPIRAALAGDVMLAQTISSYGKYIKLQHSGGLITVYAHCSELLVRKGQKVKQGDLIAKVGQTGAAVGPHLHFEIWKDGKALDPSEFIEVPLE